MDGATETRRAGVTAAVVALCAACASVSALVALGALRRPHGADRPHAYSSATVESLDNSTASANCASTAQNASRARRAKLRQEQPAVPFAMDLNHRLSCARAPVVRNVSGLCDGPPVRCAADLRAIKLYGLKRAGTNFVTSFIVNNFGTPLLCDRDVYDAARSSRTNRSEAVWSAVDGADHSDLQQMLRRDARSKERYVRFVVQQCVPQMRRGWYDVKS